MSSAYEIRCALGPTANGKCRCPHCGGKNLAVTDKDGSMLVKCWNGCTQEAVIATLRERGLWGRPKRGSVEDRQTLPPDHRSYFKFRKAVAILRAAAASCEKPSAYLHGRGIEAVPDCAMLLSAKDARRLTGKGYPAMVVPVVDSSGKLVGAHLTWLNKDATEKLAIDKPKRSYGAVGGGYVPLKVHEPEEPLVIAEGVETALSAGQIAGLPAIAALGSANLANVNLPPCSELIIAADNDIASKKAAEVLADRVRSPERVVRIAVPRGPKGYDFNDALCACGADPKELRRSLIHSRRTDWLGVEALTMEQFMNFEFPPQEYLMRPWLSTSSLAMIHAQRGHSKTQLALAVAYAVATGQGLMDWTCEKPGRVLYVDGELGGSLLKSRFKMLGDSASDLLVLSDSLFRQKRLAMPKIDDEVGQGLIDKIVERHDIDLLILDSLSTLASPEIEKDPTSWMPIQAWALKHRSLGRSIIFVHHDSRGNKPRGHSKKEDILDTMIQLKLKEDHTESDATKLEIHFTKHRAFFGQDAAPKIAFLATREGHTEWTSQSVQENARNRVRQLMDQGWKQKDIAKEIGVTEGRISQLAKEIRAARAYM